MTKIGVGIGEEFPADDSKPAEAPRGDRRNCAHGSDEARAARREAHRKWREQRREWRRQWKKARNEQRNERRSYWRLWSRNFQRALHDDIVRNISRGIGVRSRDFFREPDTRSAQPPQWSQPLLWAILALIAIIALVSFVFANLFTIVGAVAILALIAAYYRGHDPFALEPEDRSPSHPAAS